MALGYDTEPNIVNEGDTATMRAFLYHDNDQPYTTEELVSVEFTIQAPDATETTVSGSIEDDGSAKGAYDTTNQIGQFLVVAAFLTLEDGIKSARADFEVIDPFAPAIYSQSYVVAAWAWSKFEDCFDAEDEGPWLRDMTLNYFNKRKMEDFIDAALMDINLQNPPTAFGIEQFVMPAPDMNTQPTATASLPLLATGVMIQVIRHLMRSYTEQPAPEGAQIAWHDRRDYLQRWQSVYQIEYAQYMRILALWKRQFLGLGHSKLLVSAKAGRLIPAPMRTRFIGRGYWALAPLPLLLPHIAPLLLVGFGGLIAYEAYMQYLQSRTGPRDQLLYPPFGARRLPSALQRVLAHLHLPNIRKDTRKGLKVADSESTVPLGLLQDPSLRRLWRDGSSRT